MEPWGQRYALGVVLLPFSGMGLRWRLQNWAWGFVCQRLCATLVSGAVAVSSIPGFKGRWRALCSELRAKATYKEPTQATGYRLLGLAGRQYLKPLVKRGSKLFQASEQPLSLLRSGQGFQKRPHFQQILEMLGFMRRPMHHNSRC